MHYLKAILTTLLALLLSMWLSSDVNSDYITTMLFGVKDVEFSDFYDRVIYNKSEKDISNDIIIVSIDSIYGRNDIAKTLSDIILCEPKIVSVDVLFEESHGIAEDSLLMNVVANNKRIIIAREIDSNTESPIPTIFDDIVSKDRFCFVNLVKRNSQTVRSFLPIMNLTNDTILSFAMKTFSEFDSTSYQKYRKKLRDEEKILFPPVAFNIIDGREVLLHQLELKDKVVLVGCTNDIGDFHITPLEESMAGLEIWAIVIDNFINARFLNSIGTMLDYIVAITCCLFLCFLYIRLNDTNMQNFGLRLAPMVLIITLCFLGCYLYSVHIYLNISKAILLSALGILILDIFYALSDLMKFIVKKMDKKSLITMCICFSCIFAHAQNKYVIHKIGGTVEMIHSTQNLSKGAPLGDNDKIRIGNQSFISVIDKTNNKLYEYKKPGIYSISDIILSCKNEANSVTSGFIREIRSNIEKGDGKNTRAVGAVRRGDTDDLIMEQIYAFILQHMNDAYSNGNEVEIKLSRTEDSVSLILVNNTNKTLYANVLQVANGLKPNFCFNMDNNTPCLILLPHSEFDMSHVKMIDTGQKFLLVCSDASFDSEGIQFMIDEQLEPRESVLTGCQCFFNVLMAH